MTFRCRTCRTRCLTLLKLFNYEFCVSQCSVHLSAGCFYLVDDASCTNLGRQQISILFIWLFMPQKWTVYGGPEGSVPPNPFDFTGRVLCQRLVGHDFVLNHPAEGAVLFDFYAKCWKVKRDRWIQTSHRLTGRSSSWCPMFWSRSASLSPLCFSPRASCMFPKTGYQIWRIREAAVHVHLPVCHQQETQAEVNVTAYDLIGFRPSLIFMFIGELGVLDESPVSHSNNAAFRCIQIILCCQKMLLSPSVGTAPQDDTTPPPPIIIISKKAQLEGRRFCFNCWENFGKLSVGIL